MRILTIITFLVVLTSCTVEPEPIAYGEDACHHCKMTLMDTKFGAELVTQKGKVYKFDDVNCMLNFYHSGAVPADQFAYKLVVDFSRPSTLIESADAFYLKSPEIKSPMASHVAAFRTQDSLKQAQSELGGIYMVWGELVSQFK